MILNLAFHFELSEILSLRSMKHSLLRFLIFELAQQISDVIFQNYWKPKGLVFGFSILISVCLYTHTSILLYEICSHISFIMHEWNPFYFDGIFKNKDEQI